MFLFVWVITFDLSRIGAPAVFMLLPAQVSSFDHASPATTISKQRYLRERGGVGGGGSRLSA